MSGRGFVLLAAIGVIVGIVFFSGIDFGTFVPRGWSDEDRQTRDVYGKDGECHTAACETMRKIAKRLKSGDRSAEREGDDFVRKYCGTAKLRKQHPDCGE